MKSSLSPTRARNRLHRADLISQAEHSEDSFRDSCDAVKNTRRTGSKEVELQTKVLPRQSELASAFENHSAALVVPDLAAAINLANAIAPEHVELHVERPFEWIGAIRNAGAILVGP